LTAADIHPMFLAGQGITRGKIANLINGKIYLYLSPETDFTAF
jgi:hypothetical protein